ncbi:type II toxin-antitoxin system RelE/ParE family toxin [Pseudoduganella danionis]|uniref:type II toxin-antitoxin system RelE/ParE family toxin n=1 Tax=Pseudoduganella danionis TaxID=1890295 RepID=UPI0035B4580A
MNSVFWTPEAIQDREDIFEYIGARNPEAAIMVDEMIAEKAAVLAAHPELGKSGRVPATRELVIHRHYVLVYDRVGAVVRILRILHVARDRPD